MSLIIDHAHEEHEQTGPPPDDSWGPERAIFTPPEMEDSFEEIER